MADTGLWNIASEHPDLTAVVDPGGREIDYRQLADYADRYGRGLQQLGLDVGDCLVVMLPNTIELVALYFAAMECGLYIVPINWHLTGPEIAYIVRDCEAKAFIGHERFADAAGRRRRPGCRSRRFAVGDIAGFGPYEPTQAPAGGRAREPHRGCADELHVGHDRQAEGRAPAADRRRPGRRADAAGGLLRRLRHQAVRRQRAHLRLAAVPHGGAQFRRQRAPARPHGRADGQVDAEEMLRLIEKHRVTHSHMVPTQFIRLLALPEEVRALRRVVAAH